MARTSSVLNEGSPESLRASASSTAFFYRLIKLAPLIGLAILHKDNITELRHICQQG